MRALLLAALLLVPARLAAWGEKPPLAFLAVPAEDFSDWKALADAVNSTPELKLTLALTPDMVTEAVRDSLSMPLRTGRLELAMRIPGDPILPLVAAGPSSGGLPDILASIALAREKFRSVLSTAPAGFVPGGGSSVAALPSALPALGISWVAVGKGPPSLEGGRAPLPEGAVGQGPRSLAGGPWLPFTPLRCEGRPPTWQEFEAAAKPDPSLPAGPASIVLDEASGLVPRGSLTALVKVLADRSSVWTWQTASEYQASALPAASGPGDWPGWAPAALGDPAVQSAGKAYGEAAGTLRRYQNSGLADLKALEHAAEALAAAQAGRYYRALSGAAAGDAEAARQELRRHLREVYRRLKQTVPASSTAEVSAPDEVPTGVQAEQGPGWLVLRNPAGSVSRGPDKGAPAEPWRLLDLRLDWDAASVGFSFRMAALDVSSATPSAPAGRLVLDAYVDINGVPGAGSPRLLEGRGAFAANRDSWEYALSLGPSGGVLLRAMPDSGPAVLARVPVRVDESHRVIRAEVPRSLLRGNPLRWGYIAAAFAARQGAPSPEGRRSPLPEGTGPDEVIPGGPLGLLAPVEQQTHSSGGRLAAVRLP
ncbi:MAG: hypothetical protein HY926_07405 [Elusimicrobia bacterium]|nr:hypothetical protein [Elusimicrobiota bacterium]